MTEINQTLQPLSASEVAELQARFLARVEKKAANLLQMCEVEPSPATTQTAFVIVMHALRLRAEDMLFKGRVKPALDAAACNDLQADRLLEACLDKLTLDVDIREQAKSIYGAADMPKTLSAKFNAAAQRRKISPRVAAFFGEEDRLYFPLPAVSDVSQTQQSIAQLLEKQPQRYSIADWQKGLATDQAGKQVFKIGKLLAPLDDTLYKAFQEDPSRLPNNKMLVVISRRADDIARASTNRAWTSCNSPNNPYGGAFDAMEAGIKNGMLIAYLISENDPDILNPLGRVLIKPFDRWSASELRGNFNFMSDMWGGLLGKQTPQRQFYVVDKPYGLNSAQFVQAVYDIIQAPLNKNTLGHYHVNDKKFYCDAWEKAIVHSGGNIEVIGWRHHDFRYDNIQLSAKACGL